MPYDVTFKDKRIVKRFFGFVSAKEFESSASRTSASSAFDECRYVIIDFTDIDGHDLTVESFEFASAQQVVAKSANRMVHVAIVTGDADIAKFALTAIDAQGTSGFPTRVFSSVDDALTWFSRLGRNPP